MTINNYYLSSFSVIVWVQLSAIIIIIIIIIIIFDGAIAIIDDDAVHCLGIDCHQLGGDARGGVHGISIIRRCLIL